MVSDQPLLGKLCQLAARDPFAQWLGVSVDRAGPGSVDVSMTLREEHLNFNGTCHGGVLFSLADTAFGLASNSHGDVAVGVHADIAFCSPGLVGSKLVAQATEVSRSRRVGTYRVEILDENSKVVGIFTGTVHRTSRPQQ